MLGSPKECGPRGLRVALSPWPFLSGILSVDAPLRNFSRGLLIGSHCSGAFIAAHQQHHRRRRSLATKMGRDSSALRSFCYLQKQISRVSIAQSAGFTCGIQLLGSCVHNCHHHSALDSPLDYPLFTVIAETRSATKYYVVFYLWLNSSKANSIIPTATGISGRL
jgi:hypothetical protein